jgi:hypothetical protein
MRRWRLFAPGGGVASEQRRHVIAGDGDEESNGASPAQISDYREPIHALRVARCGGVHVPLRGSDREKPIKGDWRGTLRVAADPGAGTRRHSGEPGGLMSFERLADTPAVGRLWT